MVQPDCLINSRIGNGAYDYVSLGDNDYPKKLPKGYDNKKSLNDIGGFKYSDGDLVSARKIARRRKKLNRLGINYLLNAGPDGLGRIPSVSKEILL